MRAHLALACLLLSLAALGCRAPQDLTPAKVQAQGSAWLITPSGLGILDLAPGTGPSPTLGQSCTVEVLGWIEEKGEKGRLILDTRKRGFPAKFPLGVGRVIKGWDEGLATMKKGGKRLLRIPPPLGYSPREAREDIPLDANLLFEFELVDIR